MCVYAAVGYCLAYDEDMDALLLSDDRHGQVLLKRERARARARERERERERESERARARENESVYVFVGLWFRN